MRIAGANGEGGFDQADIGHRTRNHELLFRQFGNKRHSQDDDVCRRAVAQFVRHDADRAKLAGNIESGQALERRCQAGDQTLRCTAAQDVHGVHEVNSIAAMIRSRVIGRSRTRTPSASNTALAMAAVTGPWAASPAPTGSISDRWMTSTSTSGTSLKRRIG